MGNLPINTTPTELFEHNSHLAEATLYKLLKQPHNVARSKSIEFDDLLQYANLGLWRACTTYENTSKFETHAINHIRWSVMDGLNIDCNQFRYNYRLVDKEDEFVMVSMDSHIDDGEDARLLHDMIADESVKDKDRDIENRTKANIFLSKLTKRQQQIVTLKAEGYSEPEIASRLDISKQSVNQTYSRIIDRYQNEGAV